MRATVWASYAVAAVAAPVNDLTKNTLEGIKHVIENYEHSEPGYQPLNNRTSSCTESTTGLPPLYASTSLAGASAIDFGTPQLPSAYSLPSAIISSSIPQTTVSETTATFPTLDRTNATPAHNETAIVTAYRTTSTVTSILGYASNPPSPRPTRTRHCGVPCLGSTLR